MKPEFWFCFQHKHNDSICFQRMWDTIFSPPHIGFPVPSPPFSIQLFTLNHMKHTSNPHPHPTVIKFQYFLVPSPSPLLLFLSHPILHISPPLIKELPLPIPWCLKLKLIPHYFHIPFKLDFPFLIPASRCLFLTHLRLNSQDANLSSPWNSPSVYTMNCLL